MDKRNAVEYKGYYGSTLDEAVNTLIDLRNNDKNFYILFNGYKLYSCDVTLDSAYLLVTGYDKKTYDELVKKEHEEFIQKFKSETTDELEAPEMVNKQSKQPTLDDFFNL